MSMSSCGMRAACPWKAGPRHIGRGWPRGVPRARTGERWAHRACARSQPGPSDLSVCEGKEAAGRAGEDSSAGSNLLLRDSPGTAPGKARSLFFPLQPPAQRLLSVHPGGGGRRAPEGTLRVIPGWLFLPGDTAGLGSVPAARGIVHLAGQEPT